MRDPALLRNLFHALHIVLFWCILGRIVAAEAADFVASISNTPLAGQAQDKRLGILIPETSVRWASSPNMNFLATYGFEDFDSQGKAVEWWASGTSSMAVFSRDSAHVGGNYSQKIQITNYVDPVILNQFQSNREFLAGQKYRLGCYFKGQGLTKNVKLLFRLSCDTVQNFSQGFPVGTAWQYYEMEFTPSTTCRPIDPYYGGWSFEQIQLESAGSLWVDNCQMYAVNDVNGWGLSKSFIDNTAKLRPSTLRYGGLGPNTLTPAMVFGGRFDHVLYKNAGGEVGGDPFDFNQFLKLCELTGADPEYVLSQQFTAADVRHLMEYMYGDTTTIYGKMRQDAGFDSWRGKFQRIYFELGNEVLRNGNGSTLSPQQYAAWSADKIQAFKSSPYYEPAIKVGLGLWYDDCTLNVPTLLAEKNAAGGGAADFFLLARYFPFANDSTRASQYSATMGEAAYQTNYAAYMREMAAENYSRPIDGGIYEFGVDGARKDQDPDRVHFLTSLGVAVGQLDAMANMRKQGMNPVNDFYLMGFGWAWGAMDDYSFAKKRPFYYALQMYGDFVRGDLITANVTGTETFTPAYSGSVGYGCSGYGVTTQPSPVNVPTVAVYPYKSNQRYSYLIINRNMSASRTLDFNITSYTPSSRAVIVSLTGNDPYLWNDDTQQVSLNHQVISDFSSRYHMTLNPYSAYLVVNYEQGAAVCLDDDGDGYPENQYEAQDCSRQQIDCADYARLVYPGNTNSDCDCNDGDLVTRGRPEALDGRDNDCDGTVDETANSSSSSSVSSIASSSPSSSAASSFQSSQRSSQQSSAASSSLISSDGTSSSAVSSSSANSRSSVTSAGSSSSGFSVSPILDMHFDDNPSGGIVVDGSRFGNNGTCAPGATCPSFSNGSYGFDGLRTVITIQNQAPFNFDRYTPLTMSAWVSNLAPSNCAPIIAKGLAPSHKTYKGYALSLDCLKGTRPEFSLIQNLQKKQNIVVTGSTDITAPGWHHIAVTYDGSNSASGIRLYVDGALEAPSRSSGTLKGSILTSYPPKIGGSSQPLYLLGMLDEVKVFDQVLNGAAIRELFALHHAQVATTPAFENVSIRQEKGGVFDVSTFISDPVEVKAVYVSVSSPSRVGVSNQSRRAARFTLRMEGTSQELGLYQGTLNLRSRLLSFGGRVRITVSAVTASGRVLTYYQPAFRNLKIKGR